MKTVKSLETEYASYEIGENFIDNYRSFSKYIDDVIDAIGKNWESCYNQIMKNDRWKKVSKFRNRFSFLFTPEDIEQYDRDNDILLDTGAVLIGNLDYYTRIRNVSSSENYVELNKLLNFLLDQYENNIKYLNSKRKQLTSASDSTHYEDTTEIVSEFVEKELSKYEMHKQYVKTYNR